MLLGYLQDIVDNGQYQYDPVANTRSQNPVPIQFPAGLSNTEKLEYVVDSIINTKRAPCGERVYGNV